MSAPGDTSPYITITQGIRGYFAVHMWWNPERFWEPWQSGFGSYRTPEAAMIEAEIWAKAEGLRLVIPEQNEVEK